MNTITFFTALVLLLATSFFPSSAYSENCFEKLLQKKQVLNKIVIQREHEENKKVIEQINDNNKVLEQCLAELAAPKPSVIARLHSDLISDGAEKILSFETSNATNFKDGATPNAVTVPSGGLYFVSLSSTVNAVGKTADGTSHNNASKDDVYVDVLRNGTRIIRLWKAEGLIRASVAQSIVVPLQANDKLEVRARLHRSGNLSEDTVTRVELRDTLLSIARFH